MPIPIQNSLFGPAEEKKEMYLFFDTETTGLPRSWNAPVTDVDNWPRLVQLAWLTYDKEGNKMDGGDYIVKPEGFTIPAETSRIHGITTERAEREGVNLRRLLEQFQNQIDMATHIVAHNLSFDEKIMGAEFLRNKLPWNIEKKEKICTMMRSIDFCAIPSSRGFKYPRLSELHVKLFGVDFPDAHNAAVDIEMTAKCFWELKKRGIV